MHDWAQLARDTRQHHARGGRREARNAGESQRLFRMASLNQSGDAWVQGVSSCARLHTSSMSAMLDTRSARRPPPRP